MHLLELMKGTDTVFNGTQNPDILGIAQNSRRVIPGGLFVAIKGYQQDGQQYISAALEKGAVAIVVETIPQNIEELMDKGIAVIQTHDARLMIAQLARTFYGKPDQALKVIGITGTNGKTSLTYILEAILNEQTQDCGVIGTIAIRYGDVSLPSNGTTPEAVDIMTHFSQMLQSGIKHVAIEVSSHALALHRVHGLDFEVGIFTNLTQDHLDFHETMAAYFDAKKQLFQQVKGLSLINIDDDYGLMLYQELKNLNKPVKSYGFSAEADFMIGDFEMDSLGSSFSVTHEGERQSFEVGIPGRFNAYNFAVAIATARYLGISVEILKRVLPKVRVPGRLERVELSSPAALYVDFAHSPDALLKVLRAVREFTKGRVICVFGCGGDRDRGKRPLMGEIAEREADLVIVTSDNPRTEDPLMIIQGIISGMRHPEKVMISIDRREAIKEALTCARPGDCILIAGKGHEDYQIIGTEKSHFDDREVARAISEDLI